MKNSKAKTFIRIFNEAKPIWGWLLLSCIISLFKITFSVISPKMLGNLIQTLYDFWAGTFITNNLSAFIAKGLVPLSIAYIIMSAAEYANMFLLNNVVSRYFTCSIRTKISEKIKHLPIKFIDSMPVGDMLRRLMDDVSQMGTSIHIIVETFFPVFLQMVIIIIIMFLESWPLAVAVLLLTPLSVFLSSKISSTSEKYFVKMFEESGKLNSVVEESYSNYATTKAYNWESETIKKHDEINFRQREAEKKANFISSIVRPCITLINALVYITINFIGGWLIIRGDASVGTVVTMVLFAKQISSPLEEVAEVLSEIQRAAAAADRVFYLLDYPEEDPGSSSFGSSDIYGNIRFEHVDFSYDKNSSLIRDFNLDIKHGQRVAIVGPTGAGKTTIVNLLMRFYDPDNGRITIDGHNICEISRKEVRGLFGMVLQDTWLFGGTIADNVAYGKPEATKDDIIKACEETYCDHFIRTLPQGYDTVIGDDATNLSGGQKQLLTIARALLADHKLLILDEATSNVDTRTEILIQNAMDKLMAGKTCFVIAHRLSTIVDSDIILVVDNGQIVETGTHNELLDKKGFYYKIYSSQYGI